MLKNSTLWVILFACLLPKIGLCGLVGQPAPPLLVKEWVKGPVVKIAPGTNIYVVEIWHTTGAPSRAAITNLSRLQDQFQAKGVVVVGISDEEAPAIKDFVQGEGAIIHYSIAADQHRETALSYMQPAGQFAVPAAFIVGTNGAVLWCGHALHGLDQALEQIVAGHYDLARAEKADVAHYQMEQYLALARRSDVRARASGLNVLAARTNDVDLLCDMAFNICTDPTLKKRDFPLANLALNEAEKLAPTNSAKVMLHRAVWLFESGHLNAGLNLARKASSAAGTPAEKAVVQSILGTMEARMEYIKDQSSHTNQIGKVPSSGAVPNGSTNGPDAAPGGR